MNQIKTIYLRRVSQIAFLAFFVGLFLSARDPLETALWPDFFLRVDPLVGLIAIVAARTLIAAFWPAVIILVGSYLLGRSFCGWVCPLGSILDGWNRLMPHARRRGGHQWKYALLLAILLLALLSFQAVWLLDPLVILHRSTTLVLYPLLVWGLGGLLGATFSWSPLEGIGTSVWNLLQGWLLPARPLQMAAATTTALIFFGILILDQFGRRFWCRVLCPLGALLGLVARFSFFGRKVADECTHCSSCGDECRMNAIMPDFISTRREECILCLECADLCTPGATSFVWAGSSVKKLPSLSLERRKTLGVIGSAAVLAGTWKTSLPRRAEDGYLIRPPGAVAEDKFLDLCLRCQECVKACSSTGQCLQPSGWEMGWDKLWTPQARMREGYCEYSCTLCGQVCPSAAIKPLSEGAKKSKVIGLAFINRSRCIPWERGEDCIVCEEHCPTPRKAIVFRLGDVELPSVLKTGIKLPYIDRGLCIGCGICEVKCPVRGESAIRVTREGEKRET